MGKPSLSPRATKRHEAGRCRRPLICLAATSVAGRRVISIRRSDEQEAAVSRSGWAVRFPTVCPHSPSNSLFRCPSVCQAPNWRVWRNWDPVAWRNGFHIQATLNCWLDRGWGCRPRAKGARPIHGGTGGCRRRCRADRRHLRGLFRYQRFQGVPGLKVAFGDQLNPRLRTTAVNTRLLHLLCQTGRTPNPLPARYSLYLRPGRRRSWLIVDHILPQSPGSQR